MRRVIPVPVLAFQMPVPFLLRAQHRLLVGTAHHDAVFVGEPRVVRIILGERVVPHRRPQVVALEAENDLENARVESGVEVRGGAFSRLTVAVVLAHPTGQVRKLVVQEDAAILHARLPLHVASRSHEQGRLAIGHDIGPPVPGGDADLFGHVIDPIDRSALVAPGNDDGRVDAGQGAIDGLEHERLPLAQHTAHVDTPLAYEPVDERTATDRADDDKLAGGCGRGGNQGRRDAGHARDVRLKIRGCAPDAGPIGRVDNDRRGHATGDERYTAAARRWSRCSAAAQWP